MQRSTVRQVTTYCLPLLFLLLSGCGRTTSAASAAASGVYVDAMTDQFLQKSFDDTKACTGLANGTYEELSVVFMPPSFDCPYYANGCSGEFTEPNLVKVGTLFVWRHELVHYLLYANTGDPDTNHHSPLFATCGVGTSTS